MDLTPTARDFIVLLAVWAVVSGALPSLGLALVELFREAFV